MTEILTESFCERCGTRYTFESAAPRQTRMGGIRVLGRGLKNFVLSDDSSLDEAMAAARSDVEREATAQQLDAFHRTFNFCMSCRQYTCGNCWNGVEARCLSCAPAPEAEIAAAASASAAVEEAPAEVDLQRLLRLTAPPSEAPWPAANGVEPEPLPAADSLPTLEPDLAIAAEAEIPAEVDAAAALAEVEGTDVDEPVSAPTAGSVGAIAGDLPEAPEADVAAASDLPAWATLRPSAPESVAADAGAASADTEAPAPEVAAPEGAAPADEAVEGFAPGENLDDAIAAYEAAQAAVAAAAAAAEGASGGGPGIDVVGQPTWPFPQLATEAPARVPPAPEPAEPVGPAIGGEAAKAATPAEEAPAPVLEVAAPAPGVEPEVEVAGAATVPALEPALADQAAAAAPTAPAAEPEAAEPEAAEPTPTAPAAFPTAPLPPAGTPSGPPQWPTGPRWPTGIPARPTAPAAPTPAPTADPLAAIMARQATEAMWAASSRDVVQPPPLAQAAAPVSGVQPCVSCGISLSATARFCRRCGTAQTG